MITMVAESLGSWKNQGYINTNSQASVHVYTSSSSFPCVESDQRFMSNLLE